MWLNLVAIYEKREGARVKYVHVFRDKDSPSTGGNKGKKIIAYELQKSSMSIE